MILINCFFLFQVLVELQPLLNDTDLHIAQLTMNLLTSVAKLHKSSLPMVQKTSLPQIFHLSQSPLLQGAALNAMLEFFQVSKAHTFWKIHKNVTKLHFLTNPCYSNYDLELSALFQGSTICSFYLTLQHCFIQKPYMYLFMNHCSGSWLTTLK